MLALKGGDLSKVSTDTLLKMRGGSQNAPEVVPAEPKSMVNQIADAAMLKPTDRTVVRAARDVAGGIGGALDVVEKPLRLTMAAGLNAVGADNAANAMRSRSDLHDLAVGGVDAVTGGIGKPRNANDRVSDFIGEMATPGVPGISKIAGEASTAARAIKATTPKARTAEELKQIYLDGREALKQVNVAPEEVQKGLVEPITKALESENPARHAPVVQTFLDELKGFARKGVNGNYLESFRQDLSQLPPKFANPIRDAIDSFYENADLPVEFRSAYAVMKRSQTLQDALTKAGDSLTKQRNAINAFLVKQGKNLTDIERQSLEAAGKSSTAEGLLRSVGVIMKPLGYFGSIFNLPAGAGGVVSGELAKAAANKLATGRIQKATRTLGATLEDLAK